MATGKGDAEIDGPSRCDNRGAQRTYVGRVAVSVVGLSVVALSAAVLISTAPDKDEEQPKPVAVTSEEAGIASDPSEPTLDIRSALVEDGSISLISQGNVLTAGSDAGEASATLRIPIAIVALQENSRIEDQVDRTVAWSSTADAAKLWGSLGDEEHAIDKIRTVLATAKSAADFPTNFDGKEQTLLASTQWTLGQQVRFATHMGCLPEAEPVVEAMGRIVPEHRWGLGAIDGALFKGGWVGTGAEGKEPMARQFGLIPVDGGFAPIAIAATAPGGTETQAQEKLTRMAENVKRLSADLRPVACVPPQLKD